MNGEIAEDDANAEDAGDGETNDRSNQMKASLSLGGINSGSNENVKVIGPDEKGDQLGKRDDSSPPGISLTGTRESSVKGKTAFSSLATSCGRKRSLPDSGRDVPGHFRRGKAPWKSYPPASNRHDSWFEL
ncbi:hypothetical protein AZE42_10964 [Rhizopogon vesiculosus]|uniref:Uncharacterized protein n=1 Tax=Rhizopogon vesiculosus TaxID=180088 RepID=A0A1J8QBD3_9AGAM|nr:hypothetical protein AZE42_10964 [Rhizopogon vesiculosus]